MNPCHSPTKHHGAKVVASDISRSGTAMSLLAVERIKLQTTRSPWWCAALVFILGVGIAAVVASVAPQEYLTVGVTQVGLDLGAYTIWCSARSR